MNAIIFCDAEGEQLTGRGRSTPRCMLGLAGQPILAYVLAGLARLSLTRIVPVLGNSGFIIKSFMRSRLPGSLVAFAAGRKNVMPESIASFARGLRLVQPSGLLIVRGHCLFGTDLVDRLVRKDEATILSQQITADHPAHQYWRGKKPTAISYLGLQYIPRGYLSALRGVIVELLAAGYGGEHYTTALAVLQERGFAMQEVDVAELLYAELNKPEDIPNATGAALELQRRSGEGQFRTSTRGIVLYNLAPPEPESNSQA